MVLNKIIKGHNLETGPQSYSMTNNILIRETIPVFDHKSKEIGNVTTMNYNLVIQGMMTQSLFNCILGTYAGIDSSSILHDLIIFLPSEQDC